MQNKIDQRNVAGVVVLYNSPVEVYYNIITYIEQVKKLYIVDNSALPNTELLIALSNYQHIHYHSLNGNKGIATALNWAAKQAILDGFTILLTMDDDTRTPKEMIPQMVDFWNLYSKPIGILSGVHQTDPDSIYLKLNEVPYKTLSYTLTSGNLLCLIAYKKIGPFWDELFIDHVDHEFGLRLNDSGYQVVEMGNVKLEHRLGYNRQIKIGKLMLMRYTTHVPIRLYYFARNGVYVARYYFKSHPLFSWFVIKELIKGLFKASFLDENHMKRIKMILRGIKDGWLDQLGEYQEYR